MAEARGLTKDLIKRMDAVKVFGLAFLPAAVL